jgi:hypothetical protein
MVRPGWPMIERRNPPEPMSRRLAIILAALLVGYTTFVFARADSAHEETRAEAQVRQDNDQATLRLICRRQDAGLRLSNESREFIATTDTVLRNLVLVSISPQALAEQGPLNERERQALQAFRDAAEQLQDQVVRVEETRGQLQKQIARLDCNEIPPPQSK